MYNLYLFTTNQAAIIALFRVVSRYVGNLPPMPGVFPDHPAPVVRNTDHGTELTTMRWAMPLPPKFGGPFVTNIRNTSSALAMLAARAIPKLRDDLYLQGSQALGRHFSVSLAVFVSEIATL
jgi:hypothetical protein